MELTGHSRGVRDPNRTIPCHRSMYWCTSSRPRSTVAIEPDREPEPALAPYCHELDTRCSAYSRYLTLAPYCHDNWILIWEALSDGNLTTKPEGRLSWKGRVMSRNGSQATRLPPRPQAWRHLLYLATSSCVPQLFFLLFSLEF